MRLDPSSEFGNFSEDYRFLESRTRWIPVWHYTNQLVLGIVRSLDDQRATGIPEAQVPELLAVWRLGANLVLDIDLTNECIQASVLVNNPQLDTLELASLTTLEVGIPPANRPTNLPDQAQLRGAEHGDNSFGAPIQVDGVGQPDHGQVVAVVLL